MKAYCTGAVFDVDGEPLLVYPSAVATIAYKPLTGKPVWTCYHDGMNASARPVRAANGLIILTNGMGRMVAVKPEGTGDITESIAWTQTKAVAKKSSQVLIGSHLYMISDNGIVSCLDSDTGQPIWQERIGGAFAASPVYDGEKMLIVSEEGDVIVFRPSKDRFDLVSKSKLGDGFKASPAIAGKDVFLRSFSKLYCVNAKP